jgi:hypothetical protein
MDNRFLWDSPVVVIDRKPVRLAPSCGEVTSADGAVTRWNRGEPLPPDDAKVRLLTIDMESLSDDGASIVSKMSVNAHEVLTIMKTINPPLWRPLGAARS